jgi:hypothetical protein
MRVPEEGSNPAPRVRCFADPVAAKARVHAARAEEIAAKERAEAERLREADHD